MLTTPTGLANGQQTTLTASLTEDGQTGLANRPVTFTLGNGTTAQTCAATTGTDGIARCDLTVDQPFGAIEVAATFAGDSFDATANATGNTIVFAYLDQGAFVVGDGSAAVGASVTLWSPQWCAQNGVSPCPAAFKGYADVTGPVPYTDGTPWTAAPGASSNPPTSLPTYMAVLTTTTVSKKGSTITGAISHVVVVEVTATTLSPGTPLTGQVVAILS